MLKLSILRILGKDYLANFCILFHWSGLFKGINLLLMPVLKRQEEIACWALRCTIILLNLGFSILTLVVNWLCYPSREDVVLINLYLTCLKKFQGLVDCLFWYDMLLGVLQPKEFWIINKGENVTWLAKMYRWWRRAF